MRVYKTKIEIAIPYFEIEKMIGSTDLRDKIECILSYPWVDIKDILETIKTEDDAGFKDMLRQRKAIKDVMLNTRVSIDKQEDDLAVASMAMTIRIDSQNKCFNDLKERAVKHAKAFHDYRLRFEAMAKNIDMETRVMESAKKVAENMLVTLKKEIADSQNEQKKRKASLAATISKVRKMKVEEDEFIKSFYHDIEVAEQAIEDKFQSFKKSHSRMDDISESLKEKESAVQANIVAQNVLWTREMNTINDMFATISKERHDLAELDKMTNESLETTKKRMMDAHEAMEKASLMEIESRERMIIATDLNNKQKVMDDTLDALVEELEQLQTRIGMVQDLVVDKTKTLDRLVYRLHDISHDVDMVESRVKMQEANFSLDLRSLDLMSLDLRCK